MLQLGTKGNMNYIQTSRTQTGCSMLLLGKQMTSKDHESSSCCNTPSGPSAWHPGLSQWAESDWGRAAWDAAWQEKSGPAPHNLHDITHYLSSLFHITSWFITSPWESITNIVCSTLATGFCSEGSRGWKPEYQGKEKIVSSSQTLQSGVWSQLWLSGRQTWLAKGAMHDREVLCNWTDTMHSCGVFIGYVMTQKPS